MTIAKVIPSRWTITYAYSSSTLIVHIISGEVTSERPTREKVVNKAGDTFIEAKNSPHIVTNTGKSRTIVYAVIAEAESLGPITVFTE